MSAFRWFRRWRGGTWYNVTPYFAWYVRAWVRTPYSYERVNQTETYPA